MSAVELDVEQYVTLVAGTTGVERIQHITRLMDLLDSIDTSSAEGMAGYVAIVNQCKAFGLAAEVRMEAERRNGLAIVQQRTLDNLFGAQEIERQRQAKNVRDAKWAMRSKGADYAAIWPCGQRNEPAITEAEQAHDHAVERVQKILDLRVGGAG